MGKEFITNTVLTGSIVDVIHEDSVDITVASNASYDVGLDLSKYSNLRVLVNTKSQTYTYEVSFHPGYSGGNMFSSVVLETVIPSGNQSTKTALKQINDVKGTIRFKNQDSVSHDIRLYIYGRRLS